LKSIRMFKNLHRRYVPNIAVARRYVLRHVLIIAVVLASIACIFLFRYAQGREALTGLLPNLMIATSVIVAILTGYLFTRFANISQTRREKFKRFIELQKELQPYQRAFYELAVLLERRYKIDPQRKRPYKELVTDSNFWQDLSNKPSATVFVRNLCEAGVRSWDYADYEIRHEIISPEGLDEVNEHLNNLSSTLCRRKHWKHVLSDLGLPEAIYSSDFSAVVIADNSTGLKTYAEKLGEELNCKWDMLDFWEEKINKALEITERMLGNASCIFYDISEGLKELYAELGAVMAFGLFLPLIILGFDMPPDITHYLSYVSLVGFIISFVIVVVSVYKRMSSGMVTRVG